jgi:hypothetical protein
LREGAHRAELSKLGPHSLEEDGKLSQPDAIRSAELVDAPHDLFPPFDGERAIVAIARRVASMDALAR